MIRFGWWALTIAVMAFTAPGARALTVDDAARVLGVSPSASLADIKAAHRKLIRRYHPDQAGTKGTEMSARVNAAFDVLENYKKSGSARFESSRTRSSAGAAATASSRDHHATRFGF